MKVQHWLALGLVWACLGAARAQTQEPCGTALAVQKLTPEQRRFLPGGQAFEQALRIGATQHGTLCDSGTVYRIPVVFHVVHNGEPLGTGDNIPDARLQEQIDILNQDYRRRPGSLGFNTDARGADSWIEFYLACRDPQGNPHPGINRLNGQRDTWVLADNSLKDLISWPTERYLNFWIADIEGSGLGWATFPASTLPGLPTTQGTDGVVIDRAAVGYSTTSRLYNKGRTATHEVGHWLGLLHVWGDGDCSATDYCEDTPPQNGFFLQCPIPSALACPGEPAPMQRNYLQYTPDTCMNIFTRDQVYRMRYVLCNTPERVTLRNQAPCTTNTQPRQQPLFQLLYTPGVAGQFRLAFAEAGRARVVLYSADGKYLLDQTVEADPSQQLNYNLSSFAAGTYALVVTQNGRQEVRRVVNRVR